MRRAVNAYVGWRVGLDIVGPMRALEQVLPAPLVEQRLAEERERLARWTADHARPSLGVWHARQRPETPSDG